MKGREPIDSSDVILASESVGIPGVEYFHVVVGVSRIRESEEAVDCCDRKRSPAAY